MEMMMINAAYEVRSRRQVPLFTTSRGLVSKKLFCEVPAHAGEHAVCVKLPSGFMAWGFDSNPELAEAKAVIAASALELAA
ncbi:MAG: hypothetical protein A2095_04120 [Sphingomonadales bacterium GWF1_63_6]|nr:MAG: hypothetical protein A2095_04120 [Sphingomonadales bacterium GWF1_63_6]